MKWYFIFFQSPKQSITLTNLDENGKSFEENLKGKKSLKLNNLSLISQKVGNEMISINEFLITEYDKDKFDFLKLYHEELKQKISTFDYKKESFKVETNNAKYYFDNEKESIIKETNNNKEELGCGKITIKSSYKKATKTKQEEIIIFVEIMPDYEKDYEIIKYSENKEENIKNIKKFMKKYVFKPFIYNDNSVGVEINFNKVFYKPEKLRDIDTIISEIKLQEKELKKIEEELGL